MSGSECAVKIYNEPFHHATSQNIANHAVLSDWSQSQWTGSLHSVLTAIQFRQVMRSVETRSDETRLNELYEHTLKDVRIINIRN